MIVLKQVMVIAGTSDARELIKQLSDLGYKVLATVTTGYGRALVEETPGIEVLEGCLNRDGMIDVLRKHPVACLVDASHPYAVEASQNAHDACNAISMPYLRFERRETFSDSNRVMRVNTYEEAAQRASEIQGNILLTIGSRRVAAFTQEISDFKERLFVRILPDSRMVAACEAQGIDSGHIIAMKGPFSEAMNCEMIRYCQASVLITKDGGEAGGTVEKLSAAERMGIPVIMVDRPQLTQEYKVQSPSEVILWVKNFLSLSH